MSDRKLLENDPERTLITLDQLSQTIEVMTNVVNRLREHLNDQIQNQLANEKTQADIETLAVADSAEIVSKKVSVKVSGMEGKKSAKKETVSATNKDAGPGKGINDKQKKPAETSTIADSAKSKADDYILEITEREARVINKNKKVVH